MKAEEEKHFREQLAELIEGGFSPNLILLREFDWKKTAVILDGLHFSAWSLLGHIRARHRQILAFMQEPEKNPEIWQQAEWPENYEPANRKEWYDEIEKFHSEIEKMKAIILDSERSIFKIHANGKSLADAAMISLHHTGYHIGQLKAVGRQLGVW